MPCCAISSTRYLRRCTEVAGAVDGSQSLQVALAQVAGGTDLSPEQMAAVMREMMSGEADLVQLGGLLTALSIKGESPAEIAAAAQELRRLMTPVQVAVSGSLVDTCGTGGDGAKLFNVSTGAALVAAAGGVFVAKHGNRAASGNSGSADVLEALGVKLESTPEQVARCIETVGVGFLFAPHHHSAMRHVGAARRALGLRTVFNLLGPLANPAGASRQLLGVFAARWLVPMAEVLRELGAERALVVHSQDGLDEISAAAPTRAVELRDGAIRELEFRPEELGCETISLAGLTVRDPAHSAQLLRAALAGQHPGATEMLALNGGAALYLGGATDSLVQGCELARDLLATGQAAEKLRELADFTRVLAEESGTEGG